MQNHTKIYCDAFGYDTEDQTVFIPSEISEDKAVDTHHIVNRSKGGLDIIENLMALTRKEHQDFGDKTEYMVYLLKIHRRRLQIAGIDFDNRFFEFHIEKYTAKTELKQ